MWSWIKGKITKNDVGLGNVDNTADKDKNVATAKGISSYEPILALGVEHSDVTIKTNNNKSFSNINYEAYSNLWGIRDALDFQWYNDHWQIGNIRSSSVPSAGFGFSYSNDGGKTFKLVAYIDTSGNFHIVG